MARVGKNKKDLARELNASLDEKFEFMGEIFEEFKKEYEEYRKIPANTKDVNLLRQKNALEKDFVEVYQPMLLEVMTGKELNDQIDQRNVDKNAYFMYKWGSIIMDEYDRKKDLSRVEKTQFREEFNQKYKPLMERELLAKEEQPKKDKDQEMERVTNIMAQTKVNQKPESIFQKAGNAVRSAITNFWNTVRRKPRMLNPGQIQSPKEEFKSSRNSLKKQKVKTFYENNKERIFETTKQKIGKIRDFKKMHAKKVAYTLVGIGLTAMTLHASYAKDINPKYEATQPKEATRMEENIQFQYKGNPHMAPEQEDKNASFRESMKDLIKDTDKELEIGDTVNTKQGVRGTETALGEGDYRICEENEQYKVGGIAAVNPQTNEIIATQPGEEIKSYEELLNNRGIKDKDHYREVLRLQDSEGNDIMWLNKEDVKESQKQELNILEEKKTSIEKPTEGMEIDLE